MYVIQSLCHYFVYRDKQHSTFDLIYKLLDINKNLKTKKMQFNVRLILLEVSAMMINVYTYIRCQSNSN